MRVQGFTNSQNSMVNFGAFKGVDLARAKVKINDFVVAGGKDSELINPARKGVRRLKEYLEGFSVHFYNRLSKNSDIKLMPFAKFDDGRLTLHLAVESKTFSGDKTNVTEKLVPISPDTKTFLLSDEPVHSFRTRFRKMFEGVFYNPQKAMPKSFDNLFEATLSDIDRRAAKL